MNEKNDRLSSRIAHCIFIGRLEREKGIDRVIAFAKILLSSSGERGRLSIYGDGSYRNKLLSTLGKYPGFAVLGEEHFQKARVQYFGHQSQKTVREALSKSHYCLMPSRFLETFGLSALEAIEQGVVVVGYDKGGLSQFLIEEGCIYDSNNEEKDQMNFLSRMEELLNSFTPGKFSLESARSLALKESFTREKWEETITKHLDGGGKRILLVTDFSHQIGGIETHVASIARILEGLGHTVSISTAMGGKSKFNRLLGVCFSLFNPIFSYKLRQDIKMFQPDIVWFHSVLRAFGPLGVRVVNTYQQEHLNNPTRIFKTYHDLSYFGFSARGFEHENDLVGELSYDVFYRQAPLIHQLFPLYLIHKYLRLKFLRKELQTVEKHFVPSDFMMSAVRAFFSNTRLPVYILPHAIEGPMK